MNIPRAVITAAGAAQRELPLQTLVDRQGVRRSVLWMLVEEARRAGIEEVAVVVAPGSHEAYREAAQDRGEKLVFLEQDEPRGYADALLRARAFAGDDAFLHLVGDHVTLSRESRGCAQQVVELARLERCGVSAVVPTRESRLTDFGAVGGTPVKQRPGLTTIDEVLEKPTPTVAEQRLHVPGLRAGHYLCFFGLHVFTPSLWPLLAEASETPGASLSEALARHARRERCLALVPNGLRYDVGSRYGLLWAQLALALGGPDREEVLGGLVEMLALGDPQRP